YPPREVSIIPALVRLAPLKSGFKDGSMKLTAPDQVKAVTLSDGTVATIRRPRGRDLVRAQEVAATENKFQFTCAMLAQITQIGGEPCVMEDIMELWASDIDLLSREAADDFLSSNASFSPSSSSGASITPNF